MDELFVGFPSDRLELQFSPLFGMNQEMAFFQCFGVVDLAPTGLASSAGVSVPKAR